MTYTCALVVFVYRSQRINLVYALIPILHHYREGERLTQAQLGEKVGLRQETISLIETGHPAARLDTILAVLAALDLEFRIAKRSRSNAAEIEEIF